jgi:hypothetical protein
MAGPELPSKNMDVREVRYWIARMAGLEHQQHCESKKNPRMQNPVPKPSAPHNGMSDTRDVISSIDVNGERRMIRSIWPWLLSTLGVVAVVAASPLPALAAPPPLVP